MPDIKLPYTAEAEELVENIREDVENVEGEITTTNAPDIRESYQLGGKVGLDAFPGDPLFGQKPVMPRPAISPSIQEPEISPLIPKPAPLPKMYEEGGEVPKYKKGGKVRK